MRRINLVLWFIVFLGVGVPSGLACSCSYIGQKLKLELSQGKVDPVHREWLNGFSGVVFIGRAVQIKKVKMKVFGVDWYNNRVTFKVERYWKRTDSFIGRLSGRAAEARRHASEEHNWNLSPLQRKKSG